MIPLRWKRFIFLGVTDIWRHRLRSALTTLGIVFGVCSVVAMLAIGEGASYEAREQIRRLGSENIIVRSVSPPQAEAVDTERDRVNEYGLTHADAARIADAIPSIDRIVPSRSIRADCSYRRKRADANAIGTVPDYFPLTNRGRLKIGRLFNEDELRDSQNVCVLSSSLANRLFTFRNPKGEAVKVRGDYFTVIGVLQEPVPGSRGEGSTDSPFELYMPLSAATSRFGEIIINRGAGSFNLEKVELHELIVKVSDTGLVISTAQVIREILKRFHKDADYEIIVPLELLRQAERTKRIFSIVLGSIAAISLLVGGIGIMNIMLASVTERTREIGIRRALGAKKRDITAQFLTETVILASFGGLIGLCVGVAAPFLITHFAGMRTIIRPTALIGAFGISVLTGIIFGMYPAYRAALMNPIAALRHE